MGTEEEINILLMSLQHNTLHRIATPCNTLQHTTLFCTHVITSSHAVRMRMCADIRAMGWLRLVGSSKLYVSFVKEPYKKRRYSAKETYNLKEPTNRSHPIPIYRVYMRPVCYPSTLMVENSACGRGLQNSGVYLRSGF